MMGYRRTSQLLGSARTASGCTPVERMGLPGFGICGMLTAGFLKLYRSVSFVLCVKVQNLQSRFSEYLTCFYWGGLWLLFVSGTCGAMG